MSTLISQKFGDTDLLFYALDYSELKVSSVKTADESGLIAETTSSLTGKITDLRKLINEVTESFGKDMMALSTNMGAKKAELELGFTLSIGGWIVGLETKNQVTLKITWEK